MGEYDDGVDDDFDQDGVNDDGDDADDYLIC